MPSEQIKKRSPGKMSKSNVSTSIDQVAVIVDRIADLVDRDRRRDLAGRVAAHAVRDHEQTELLVDEEVVLVVVALATDIRGRGERELHPRPVYISVRPAIFAT